MSMWKLMIFCCCLFLNLLVMIYHIMSTFVLFTVPSVFSQQQQGEIDVSTSKLQELQGAISKSEADLTQAQAMREKEHQEHQNAHGELGEATEMLGRAIKTLSAKARAVKRETGVDWIVDENLRGISLS